MYTPIAGPIYSTGTSALEVYTHAGNPRNDVTQFLWTPTLDLGCLAFCELEPYTCIFTAEDKWPWPEISIKVKKRH